MKARSFVPTLLLIVLSAMLFLLPGCGGGSAVEDASPESRYLGTWVATQPAGDDLTLTVTLEVSEGGACIYTLETGQEGTAPGVYGGEWELVGDKMKTTYSWLMEETDYLVLSEDGTQMTGEGSGYVFTRAD